MKRYLRFKRITMLRKWRDRCLLEENRGLQKRWIMQSRVRRMVTEESYGWATVEISMYDGFEIFGSGRNYQRAMEEACKKIYFRILQTDFKAF